MMLRIKEAEDFGLGFNCITRLYMDRYDEALIKDLIRQAIGKEKQRAHYTELQGIVNRVTDDIGVTNSWWGKEKSFDRNSFYQWVMERGLAEVVVMKEVKEYEILPLKKKYVPLFYKICNYMIDYSYGRHTYMPSTCRSFVKKNMEIMSDATLTDIVEYLKKIACICIIGLWELGGI